MIIHMLTTDPANVEKGEDDKIKIYRDGKLIFSAIDSLDFGVSTPFENLTTLANIFAECFVAGQIAPNEHIRVIEETVSQVPYDIEEYLNDYDYLYNTDEDTK